MDARTQLKMLVKPLPQDPVLEVEAVSQMSKRTTPPALNLQQYLSTARTCGRRKRKHTEAHPLLNLPTLLVAAWRDRTQL